VLELLDKAGEAEITSNGGREKSKTRQKEIGLQNQKHQAKGMLYGVQGKTRVMKRARAGSGEMKLLQSGYRAIRSFLGGLSPRLNQGSNQRIGLWWPFRYCSSLSSESLGLRSCCTAQWRPCMLVWHESANVQPKAHPPLENAPKIDCASIRLRLL
jgi:hypothetical protein